MYDLWTKKICFSTISVWNALNTYNNFLLRVIVSKNSNKIQLLFFFFGMGRKRVWNPTTYRFLPIFYGNLQGLYMLYGNVKLRYFRDLIKIEISIMSMYSYRLGTIRWPSCTQTRPGQR